MLTSRSPEEIAQLRARLVAEAMSWLLTPYLDCAAVKGKQGGVDCAMSLIRWHQAVGLVPADYDPRPYSPDWHVHQNEELYMAGLEQFAHRVETPDVGHVAIYKYGRHASHGGLIVAPNTLIHAHRDAGCVILTELDSMTSRFHSYWSAL